MMMRFSTSPPVSNTVAQQLRITFRRPTGLPSCHRVTAPAAAALPVGLRAESLPRHVAVVMDGHSRWARARGLPTKAGHEALKLAFEEVVRLSRGWGIRVLTVFVFSHENWGRPKPEVDYMMDVFERCIHENVAEFVRYVVGVRTA